MCCRFPCSIRGERATEHRKIFVDRSDAGRDRVVLIPVTLSYQSNLLARIEKRKKMELLYI